MRLKRKRKKNRSRFHLGALGYASASRTHAVASHPDWAWNPRRKPRQRQNVVATSETATKPTMSAGSKIFVAVPPAPRPETANASAVDARMRGCTKSANAWRAS